MIYGNINYREPDEKTCPPSINRAIQYVKNHDFLHAAVGVYEMEGKDIFVQVMDKETGPVEERKPEIHKKYVDIQILLSGQETIGCAVDRGTFEVEVDRLEQEDILFYRQIQEEQFLHMTPGDFAVFFPGEIHRPACMSGREEVVRKVVVKVGMHLM